jgi:PP-loop superfamily ATP-utilizing enzyme
VKRHSLRNQAIATAYDAGEKLDSIAAEHSITRQRVEQIVREMGLPRRRIQDNHNPNRFGTNKDTPAPKPATVDLGERIWCEQCERSVRAWQAAECAKPFCKAKS